MCVTGTGSAQDGAGFLDLLAFCGGESSEVASLAVSGLLECGDLGREVEDDEFGGVHGFHQHLSPLFPPGTVEREKWDVAGGRADVMCTPEPGSRFVAEIKWRTASWKTQQTVERDCLDQAANYTATGPPFALLLVGDASDHSAGYREIEESIWIIRHARSATEMPRLIVAGVLPAARPTPHSLRLRRSAGQAGR